jgi:hypothetical protein
MVIFLAVESKTCSHKVNIYRGAGKSLAQPGRRQATVNKQKHMLAKKKKNSEGCPSNQVSTAAMTSALNKKWLPFNCFFSRVGLRTYQHPCICTIEKGVRNIDIEVTGTRRA